MSVSNDSKMKKIEAQSQSEPIVQSSSSAASILRQWEREDLLKRALLCLRGVALIFSLISFIIVASNNHGVWKKFNKYEEYRYLLAIAIISSLYTGFQVFRRVRELYKELYTAKILLRSRNTSFVAFDFVGDQVMAYLLISSVSAAIPISNRFREPADNIFTYSSGAAISMSVFAFLCLAISALVSGYTLSTQTYI